MYGKVFFTWNTFFNCKLLSSLHYTFCAYLCSASHFLLSNPLLYKFKLGKPYRARLVVRKRLGAARKQAWRKSLGNKNPWCWRPDQSQSQNSAVTARSPRLCTETTTEWTCFYSFLTLGNLIGMAPAYSHSKSNKIQLSSLDSVHVQPMQKHKNQCVLIPKLEIHKLL